MHHAGEAAAPVKKIMGGLAPPNIVCGYI